MTFDDDLLARFDAEIRRDPPPETGFTYDRSGDIIRAIGPSCWIIWWGFGAAECDAAVASEAQAFRAEQDERRVEGLWP